MSDHPKLNASQIRAAVLPDLIISIVGPVLIYRFAAPNMPATDALLLAGALPLIRVGFDLIRHHRLNLIGVFSGLTVALQIFLALVLKETRWVLAGDSLITGLYGIILLASLRMSRPLLIRLIESVLPNALAGKTLPFQQRVSQSGARSLLTIVTVGWGIGLLLECGVQIILAFTLTVEQFLVIHPIVHYSFLGVLLFWAFLFARILRSRKHKVREGAPDESANEPTYAQSSNE